jgi:hypothetical protein
LPDLLERIRAELHERLDASRAAVTEYEQLQRALQALDGASPAPRGRSGESRTRRTRQAPASAAGGPRRRTAAARRRAPRGQNRERVLRVLSERPGVTPAEVVSASGLKRPIIYNELRRLVDAGEVVKQELPSGRTGYSLAQGEANGSASAPATTTGSSRP